MALVQWMPLLSKFLKAAGVVLLTPSAYIVIRRLIRNANCKVEPAAPSTLPLYGEQRSHIERFIFVRSEDVGIVLGRHMRNLRRIEYETRTFLQLVSYGKEDLGNSVGPALAYEDWTSGRDYSDEAVPETVNEERLQFIRVHAQTEKQVEQVKLAIAAGIEDSRRRKAVAEIRIPSSTVGYVIGKNGERIRRINIDCRVFTKISQTRGEMETVTIEGTHEGIVSAQERILSLVDRILETRQNEGQEVIERPAEEEIKEIEKLREELEAHEEEW